MDKVNELLEKISELAEGRTRKEIVMSESTKQGEGSFEAWYERVKVHRLSHWDDYTLARKAFEAGRKSL